METCFKGGGTYIEDVSSLLNREALNITEQEGSAKDRAQRKRVHHNSLECILVTRHSLDCGVAVHGQFAFCYFSLSNGPLSSGKLAVLRTRMPA